MYDQQNEGRKGNDMIPSKIIDVNARGQRKNHPKSEPTGVPQKKDGLGGKMAPQRFYTAGDKSDFAAKPPAREAGYREPKKGGL